jgi:hypothetical protein
MWPRFLRLFANAFIVVYAADGLISVLHILVEIVRDATLGTEGPIPGLTSLRGFIALTVVRLALVALPLLALTRKLTPSVFVPLVASTLWFATGALPFVIFIDLDSLDRVLTACQVGIAAAALLRIRELRGGTGWLFDDDWFSPPLFSPRHFAAYGIAISATLVGSFVLISVASLATGIEKVTNGFVRFDSEGVSLADRTYELEDDPLANETGASDHRRIQLIGMMHIGEEEGYRSLFRDLGQASRLTIVLSEGVSDSEGLLESGISYEALADFLGLEQQRSIEDYIETNTPEDEAPAEGATFVNADLDVSDFDLATIAWLQKVGGLYSENPGLAQFMALYRDFQAHPEQAATINEDIIARRNRNLISWINASRINYQEIIVPWGALHLPGVEKAVEEMGFAHRATTYVPLISWARLAGALFGDAETENDPDGAATE